MKTVKEVSKITGVSVRTLHHYDAIGLLKPSRTTEAGYRLYDEQALERLSMILVFRELGLSLREIGSLLDSPDFDRNRMLETQIRMMQAKIDHLQNRISFAKGIQSIGVDHMNFKEFDPKQPGDYSAQAKALYGKTDAYKEYTHKAKNRTNEQEKDLGSQIMEFFIRLGQMRPMEPGCEAARDWAKELQTFISEHYYTCTPQIFGCLAEGYADGGAMNENIDRAGGPGTGVFAKQVIDAYLANLN